LHCKQKWKEARCQERSEQKERNSYLNVYPSAQVEDWGGKGDLQNLSDKDIAVHPGGRPL